MRANPPSPQRDVGEARLWHIGTALTVSFAGAVLGLAALAWLAWLLLGLAGFRHHRSPSLHDTVGVLQLVFASVAGAGALVALIVAYRRQKVAEANSAHDRTRVFNERFTAIAAQLGDGHPAVRLAGVHAIAGLADDWKANRQTCIDVLCAYLRIPYEPDPGEEAKPADRLEFQRWREVRHTVIRVIAAHLKDDAAMSWQGLSFDFTGVVFDGGSFKSANFSGGQVDFSDAVFSGGMVDFSGTVFSGGTATFNGANFSGGTVNFRGAVFSGAKVYFINAKFSGGEVYFVNAKFSGGMVDFNGANFSGGMVDFGFTKLSGGQVIFSGAGFSGGTVSFFNAVFSGTVYFGSAKFCGGTVDFGLAEFSGMVYFGIAEFSGGTVDFRSATLSDGQLDFGSAKFSGGTVDFRLAEFCGSELDFSHSADWSVPPAFPWTDSPPPGVKLPQNQDQSQV
jgi:uncharacterized protein YjbI with pentapeptide repeats